MRARITGELIRRKGFTAVAVEADWPDAAVIDSRVRRRPVATGSEATFRRFPTWMWANREVADFVDWLRAHNDTVEDPHRQVSFSRARPVLAVHFARRGARLPRPGRPRRRSSGAGPLRLSDPLGARPGALRPRGADRRVHRVRGRRRRDADRPAASTARADRPRRRHVLRRGAERARRRQRRALLPGHVPRVGRLVEPARPAHVRDAAGRARPPRPGHQGRGVGAQLPHRGRLGDRDGRTRRAQRRPALSARVRRRRVPGRLRHRRRHGGRGVGLGWPDGTQGGAPVAPPELRAAVPRQRDPGDAARPARARPTRGPRRARRSPPGTGHRGDLPARDRAAEPLLPGRLPDQFDEYVWFDRTGAVDPLPARASGEELPDTYPFGV